MRKLSYAIFIFLILVNSTCFSYLPECMGAISSYGSKPMWDSGEIILLIKKMINYFSKEDDFFVLKSDLCIGTELYAADYRELEYSDSDNSFFKNLIDTDNLEGLAVDDLNNKAPELFNEFLKTEEYKEFKFDIKCFMDFVLVSIFDDDKKEKEQFNLEVCYPDIVLKNLQNCKKRVLFDNDKKLGLNLNFKNDFLLWENNDEQKKLSESLSVSLSVDYSYLFKRIEKRTLGIKVDYSSFISNAGKGGFLPLPNVVTTDTFVFPGNQLDCSIHFFYKRKMNGEERALTIGCYLCLNGPEDVRSMNDREKGTIIIDSGEKIPFNINFGGSPANIYERIYCLAGS